MSTTNVAVLYDLGALGWYLTDDVTAVGSVQGTAPRVPSALTRVTLAAANAGLVLPSILTGEAAYAYAVVNDSANTIKVYCALGENLNGSLNASLSVPSGQTGMFLPVLNSHGNTQDWRAVVIA